MIEEYWVRSRYQDHGKWSAQAWNMYHHLNKPFPEPFAKRSVGCVHWRMNTSTLLDYNITSCVWPFSPSQQLLEMAFQIHLKQPQQSIKITVLTNMDCSEPDTVIATVNTIKDRTIFRQCAVFSETHYEEGLQQCVYACTCVALCERIFIRQEYTVWKFEQPSVYRTCEVNIFKEFPWWHDYMETLLQALREGKPCSRSIPCTKGQWCRAFAFFVQSSRDVTVM